MTPRTCFAALEGRLLQIVFVGMSVLFLGIMVGAWVNAERARPVLLDLETGRPVAHRPAL